MIHIENNTGTVIGVVQQAVIFGGQMLTLEKASPQAPLHSERGCAEQTQASAPLDVTHEEMKEAIIPDKCVKAIEKVLVPTVSRNGVVMNTQVQMRKAVQQIDRTSNVEVAFLLMVGRELGFVKASAQTTDFVRALIGLRLLDYTSDEAIRNMADGINKKIKNLPSKHNTWAEDERTIANAIERALLG